MIHVPHGIVHLNAWYPTWRHCLRSFQKCDLAGGSMLLGAGFKSLKTHCPYLGFSLFHAYSSRCELPTSCFHCYAFSLPLWTPGLWNHKPKQILSFIRFYFFIFCHSVYYSNRKVTNTDFDTRECTIFVTDVWRNVEEFMTLK